jgi:hypothetical protein
MKNILLALSFAILWPLTSMAGFSGVEKIFKKKPPLYKLLEKIYLLTYRANSFDCSNKASLFVKLLNEAGFDSRVMIVKDEEKYGNVLHAVVLICNYENQNIVCDPTNDEWYFDEDIKTVGKFVCFIPAPALERNGEEYGFTETVYNKMKASVDRIIGKKT